MPLDDLEERPKRRSTCLVNESRGNGDTGVISLMARLW